MYEVEIIESPYTFELKEKINSILKEERKHWGSPGIHKCVSDIKYTFNPLTNQYSAMIIYR